MTVVILLAAGSSRRFGEKNKLMAEWGGKPLYLRGLEAWRRAAGGRPVFVVAMEKAVLDGAARLGMIPVESPDSRLGISFSIRAGLGAVFDAAGLCPDRIVFGVADQPLIRPATLKRILRAAEEYRYACLAWEGEWYNPAVFPREAVPELLSLSGDTGGKAVLRRHRPEVAEVAAEAEEELLDVDSEEDLARLKRAFGSDG